VEKNSFNITKSWLVVKDWESRAQQLDPDGSFLLKILV